MKAFLNINVFSDISLDIKDEVLEGQKIKI